MTKRTMRDKLYPLIQDCAQLAEAVCSLQKIVEDHGHVPVAADLELALEALALASKRLNEADDWLKGVRLRPDLPTEASQENES